ncbi:MAG: hypothetical protein NVSMB29_00070 [Candidatus Dormibacteria bacterium]
MIVFVLVLASLVLLALVGERLAGRFWDRAHPRGPLVHCAACGVRHPADRIVTVASAELCPRGHAIVHRESENTRVGTAAIFVLAAFVACGVALLATGVIRAP